MRTIPPALQTALDSGVTTLCRCWRIDRADGVSLGFTDHDQAVRFDGVDFEPGAGVLESALEVSSTLDLDNIEIAGALTSAAITDLDIERGRYDGADVRRWLVDWTDPETRLLTFRGFLGEIRRRGALFEAEARGLSERLATPQGRQIFKSCDAALGDARCGVDLTDPAYRAAGVIQAVEDRRRFRVSGLESYEAGWFSEGRLQFDAGPAVPFDVKIVAHRRDAASAALGDWIELQDESIDAITVGQSATMIAGCDKRFDTCAAKFSNRLNFRGFPHAPGDDWLLAYPRQGDRLDGGSRLSE